MEIVFEIEKPKIAKARKILLSDDIVSRGSITFKESESLGFKKDVYYCCISGLEEATKKSKDLMKELGKEVDEKTKSEIIKKIKEEEEDANAGFGYMFR